MARRQVRSGAICLAAAMTLLAGFQAVAEEFRVSLSVSPFADAMIDGGVVYHDGERTASTVEELQQMFVANGSNEVYARIGTQRTFQPGNGDHSVVRGLERARMAKQLGLPFNPEIGLFKSYGDISHQPPPDFSGYPEIELPGEWTSLTIDQMTPILKQYGELVAREILETGVDVRIWDLGNEVELGVAGVAVKPTAPHGHPENYRAPDGVNPEIGKHTVHSVMQLPEDERIAWLETHLWPYVAKIFVAVADGIRVVDPDARFSTHISGVGAVRPKMAAAFFKAMEQGGCDFAELGFSYYPTSPSGPHDRLLAFQEAVELTYKTCGKPIFIAEFGYPAGTMEGFFSWNRPVEGYPQTNQGQAEFLETVVEWGARNGMLSGIRPWAPDLAKGWDPMSFFDFNDKQATARPALNGTVRALKRAAAN